MPCGRAALLLLLALVLPERARAMPVAPSVVCESLPEAAECQGRVASCATCHLSTWPATRNAYGASIERFLSKRGDVAAFTADLPGAIARSGSLDADDDGVSNLDELLAGTNPGDAHSAWPYCPTPSRPLIDDTHVAEGYDFRRALTRVSVLYCGHSPSYDELAALSELSPAAQYTQLHATLDGCLASDYWRDEGLARLADARIRPVGVVGIRSPFGLTIGDFDWDYRLWSYALTQGRDARQLLLADYHVARDEAGKLVEVEGPVPSGPASGPQPLAPEHRAGMLTTQWFFAINTMFSPLPRTAAAQAYRAYLGLDLSRLEGIVSVPGEPRDVDAKGVADAQCAGCHATLDPLSYPFASYEGISLPAIAGTYRESRPSYLIDGWDEPQGALLGVAVDNLRQWAEVAAASDAFARNLALMFFRQAFAREPAVPEHAAFDALWRSLPEEGYAADRLLHRLVDLDAFGGLSP